MARYLRELPRASLIAALLLAVTTAIAADPKLVAPDGLTDVHHETAQAVIAGANMILVDIHPRPELSLCDGPHALLLEELPHFLEDVRICREAYEKRLAARAAAAAAGGKAA